MYINKEKFCAWCGKSSLYEAIDEHHYHRRRKDKDATIKLCRTCHIRTEQDRKFFEKIRDYAQQYKDIKDISVDEVFNKLSKDYD